MKGDKNLCVYCIQRLWDVKSSVCSEVDFLPPLMFMKMTMCTVIVGLETRCCYIFPDDLRLAILLPQSAKC